jgi:uncharacterized membrane protein
MAIARSIAILCTALFAGAALYVSLVEHPARMSAGMNIALAEFAPSYHRGARMQAPLALVAFLASLAAWGLDAGLWWLIAGLLIGVAIPFTLIVIKRVNTQLLASARNPQSPEARELLVRWGQLHAVRTALSLAALAMQICVLTF